MDAAAISSALLNQQQGQVQAQASILTLRKALDLEQSLAQQLLQALPGVPRSNPTASLGNTIDTFA